MSAGHRVYLKTLRDEQMDSLRNSLTAAHADGWRGGGSGSRMVLEAAGMQRVIGLPAGDETVEALAALLRVLVSGSS